MMPEVQAKFCLTGREVTPEEITQVLGIAPTETWIIGDLIQGTRLKRKHNGWCVATPLEERLDLRDPIAFLLQRLQPKAAVISDLCQRQNLELELSCVAYIVDQTPVISLDQEVIASLAQLKASLDVDIILVE